MILTGCPSTVQIDKDTHGITMLGRSDGVLNPQGVRFGSAELYAVVEEIKDEWVKRSSRCLLSC
jgi:hypothetical protein